MFDTRLFGFLAIAFLSLLIYQAWITDYATPVAATVPETVVDYAEPALVDSGVDGPAVSSSASPASVTNSQRSEAVSETFVRVETDTYHAAISTRGGALVQLHLKQYPISVDQPDQPFVLLDQQADNFFVAQSSLRTQEGPAPDRRAQFSAPAASYTLGSAQQLEVPLTWTSPDGVVVTKTYRFTRDHYAIEVETAIDNQSNQNWSFWQTRELLSRAKESAAGLFATATYTGGVYYNPDDKYQKIDFDEMADDPLNLQTDQGWVAMIQHYFAAAWIPPAEQQNKYYSGAEQRSIGTVYRIGIASPLQTLASGQRITLTDQFYGGPKIQERMEAVAPGLELTVDFGILTIISQPLFSILEWIEDFIGNWGWAIIILTVLIKLAFMPLSASSYRSMAKMRKLQPEMVAIRERYQGDRQKQGLAVMELYRKEKVNPIGGCLPVLIQMPVFFALYWVFLESVELRQAPWILWIEDLSTRDPFFILPLLMGVSMYFQQKLNPAPADPMQAKVMSFLPWMFTLFLAFFPAGLVLYWTVNNLMTIAQQGYIYRKLDTKPGR